MKWEVEPWRKVYVNKSPSWLRLPVSARGLGRELVTYVDDRGEIDIGDDPPGVAIAYLLGARPKEHKRIAEDVAELMKGADPYLVHDGSVLRIRNFVPAQDRTPGAKRTAAWRERKAAEAAQAKDTETSQGPSHVTSHERLSGDVSANERGDVGSCRVDLFSERSSPKDLSGRRAREPAPAAASLTEALRAELERRPITAPIATDEWVSALLGEATVSRPLAPADIAEAVEWAAGQLALDAAPGGGKGLTARAIADRVKSGLLGAATKRKNAPRRATEDPAASYVDDPEDRAYRQSVMARLAAGGTGT